MRRLVFAALLVALSGQWAQGAECKDLTVFKNPQSAKSLRILRAFDDVRWVSGDSRPVLLCEFKAPSDRWASSLGWLGHSYIFVNTSLLKIFSDSELRVILGHEMAHIMLGHAYLLGGSESAEQHIAQEIEADAQSAKWFGVAVTRTALEKSQRIYGKLFGKEMEADGLSYEGYLSKSNQRLEALRRLY